MAVLLPQTAFAETTVNGHRDSNAPLVIDPTSDPTDPLLADLPTNPSPTVVFIQRMPVTKVISQITLGDIGQWSGCAPPTTTRIYVREHPAGGDLGSELNDSQQIVYSPTTNAMPVTPGPITYTIPPTTFHKGRGYSINLSATNCSHVRMTTWEHNDPAVNGGPDPCTESPTSKRIWHVNGLDDAIWECVNRLPGARNFDPSMPTGWLASRLAGTSQDITWGFHAAGSGNVCDLAANPDPLALGAEEHYWRHRVGQTNPDWVCIWSQFADHGTTVPHGWYYALPWRVDRGGAPRDIYVRLNTVDYDALLAAHAPILKYDSGETFHAISPGAMTDFDDSPPGGYSLSDAFVGALRDGAGEEIAAAGSPGPGNGPWPPVLVLGTLGENYWFGPNPEDQPSASSSDYLDPRGNSTSTYEADAASMAASSAYADKVYGRVAHGGNDGPGGEMDDRLWLQYWMFYYHNPIEFLAHEGDWEMVQIGLDATHQPDVAVYNQHDGGEVCEWGEVEVSGTHPIVYVAEGSHASYFGPERIPVEHIYDHADGLGGTLLAPDLVEITTDNPRWTGWPGTWGNAWNSPQGPRFQTEKWSDPTGWKSGLDTC